MKIGVGALATLLFLGFWLFRVLQHSTTTLNTVLFIFLPVSLVYLLVMWRLGKMQ